MQPSINDGDLVIYKPLFSVKENLVKKGSIVVLSNPIENKTLIIKRVDLITDKGLIVMGDNNLNSIDSRHFGQVSFKYLRGIVDKVIPIDMQR